jgi:hypothetical protein
MRQLMRTARTLGAEWWQVLWGSARTERRKMSQVLGTFGLLDFTLLQYVLAWRAFWIVWTIYFFNFPIYFQAAVNCRYWISGYGGMTVYSTETQQNTIISGIKEIHPCCQLDVVWHWWHYCAFFPFRHSSTLLYTIHTRVISHWQCHFSLFFRSGQILKYDMDMMFHIVSIIPLCYTFRHYTTVSHGQAVCRSAVQSTECTYLLLLEWGTVRTQFWDLPAVSGGSVR